MIHYWERLSEFLAVLQVMAQEDRALSHEDPHFKQVTSFTTLLLPSEHFLEQQPIKRGKPALDALSSRGRGLFSLAFIMANLQEIQGTEPPRTHPKREIPGMRRSAHGQQKT
jgi:hypothetical protein